MVVWPHRLDGHEFEQVSGVGDGQGSLTCCSPWGHTELDTTEQLNWTELDILPHLCGPIFDLYVYISSVQFSHSVMSNSANQWTTAYQASLSITNSRSILKLMPIESVMPCNRLILWCLLFLLPSIFPSIRVFSNESVLRIRWPKYWSFGFTISPSNEYSGLISIRMNLLDLLAVQGTPKSFPQDRSPKASILWHSAFFIVWISHPYMPTGKTVALDGHLLAK